MSPIGTDEVALEGKARSARRDGEYTDNPPRISIQIPRPTLERY